MFQLAPETVLLTVDGEPLSLDQLNGELAAACLKDYYKPDYLKTLILETARQDLAVQRLAAEKGFSLDLIVNREDVPPSSKPGESAASAQWRADHDVLLSLLAFHYDPDNPYSPALFFHQLPPSLKTDLDAAAAALSAVPAPALDAMDLAAAQARLLASPYCD